MLDCDSPETRSSLQLLAETLKANRKPLVFWIGAGASKWCGYLLWGELADKFHSNFLKTESSYDRSHASLLLDQALYPRFFDYCKRVNERKYRTLLANFL